MNDSASYPPLDQFASRLDELRSTLDPTSPESLGALAASRQALVEMQAQAEGWGCTGLATALRRLALMTELWECLATAEPASVSEVVAFCLRVLDQLAGALRDGDPDKDLEWVVQESTGRWGDYLALLEPGRTDTSEDVTDFTLQEPAEEAETPAIDLAGLLRLLAGNSSGAPGSDDALEPESTAGAGTGQEARNAESLNAAVPTLQTGAQPRPQPPEIESASLASLLETDPEIRQVFLAEATDLHERLETLALGLDGSDPPADARLELCRCLHTLKGTAGSVGLAELAALVHQLEDRLKPQVGMMPDGWADLLHELLDYFADVMAALQRGVPLPPAPQALLGRMGQQPTARAVAPGAPSIVDAAARERPGSPHPASTPEAPDGTIRISCERIEELMDLVAELITGRGLWAAQAGIVKEFAATARLGRNRLMASIDRLRSLALTRAPRAYGSAAPPGPWPSPVDGVDLVGRLAEQAEDLAALAETARCATDSLADATDTLGRVSLQLWDALQAFRVVPVRGLFHRLARVAREAARVEDRSIEVILTGADAGLDRSIQERAFEPLMHAVRNAVGHGIEPAEDRVRAGKPPVGRVMLEACREGYTLALKVEDDGRGLDYAAIAAKGRRLGLLEPGLEPTTERLHALVFQPGFSTRAQANAIAGRGVGMDVVTQEVSRLHGTVALSSHPGRGTTLTIRLPARLALEQAMVVRVDGQPFALPLDSIELAQPFLPADLDTSGSHGTVRLRADQVRLIDARRALGLPATAPLNRAKLLLVRADSQSVAFLVDAIDGPRELVLRPLNPLLAGHPLIAGTSLSPAGELVFVLDPFGLVRHQTDVAGADALEKHRTQPRRASKVLVVDDAISVRRVARKQLRSLGLEIDEAADGMEALCKLRSSTYQLILTDLDMPRMDGFELLAELARSGTSAATPVVVISTRSDAQTERRVLNLGARKLLSKPIGPDDFAGAIAHFLHSNPLPEPTALSSSA